VARGHRTYWIVRQRYRRSGLVGSALAVMLAAANLVPIVHGAQGGPGYPTSDLLGACALLVVAAVIPWLIARVCWRLHRRRYLDDMYALGPR
jgi:hypothetical protein